MSSILEKLGEAVEAGKVDKNSPYPPLMKGQDGADELAMVLFIRVVHRVNDDPVLLVGRASHCNP